MTENERSAGIRKEMYAFSNKLFEKYGVDCVQIFASTNDLNGTACHKYGMGNYYARIGMTKEFLDRDMAITNCDEMSGISSDDGEDWKDF